MYFRHHSKKRLVLRFAVVTQTPELHSILNSEQGAHSLRGTLTATSDGLQTTLCARVEHQTDAMLVQPLLELGRF